MGWACITHRAKRNACRIFVRKPKGKKSLGRTDKWDNDIKIDPRGIVWGSMD
jgi:hypothetical protein